MAEMPRKSVGIFVASSSELKEEREKISSIFDHLEVVFKHLHIKPLKWEGDLPSGSVKEKRIQDAINPLLEQAEIVLVMLYSKIGEFTREEYSLARKKNKKVFLYFKKGYSPQKKDIKQYNEVLDFIDEVEKENQVLYKKYNNLEEFRVNLIEDLSIELSQEFPIQAKTQNSKLETDSSKNPVSPVLPVRDQLLTGSRKYYEALRGPNGRFRFLNISEIILPGMKTEWFDAPVSVNPSKNYFPDSVSHNIIDALPVLWKKPIRHVVIVGEGGMGKTVSLIHLWEKMLGNMGRGPVPVYLALNELNQVDEKERKNFILNRIWENYGENKIQRDKIKEIMRIPFKDGKKFIPSVVMLLDGFNEITVEKRELLIELNDLVEKYGGIQVVITSRSDMRSNFNWSHWNLVKLQELDEGNVTRYLKKQLMSIPKKERLFTLLKNPMMLTLYAVTCEIQKKHAGAPYCFFKRKVEMPGEVLWNFMESQVALCAERMEYDPGKIIYFRFMFSHLLTGLGFEMEKVGLFDFSVSQLEESIDRTCRYLGQPSFLYSFREFVPYAKVLPIGECANEIDRLVRIEELKRILTDGLHLVVKEGESFRFLHQNFRDFFAAVHVLNEMEVGIKKKEIPKVLKEEVLDYYVRRYIGEIEGEHYIKPYIDENEKIWKIDINNENRLYYVLELCRRKFGEEIGYTVWNIVTIWKELREGLSGVDLSQLDLTKVVINGVKCSLVSEDLYLSTIFDRSIVHERTFLPQGHSLGVTSAVYNMDGKKILSVSWDNTIKEWDAGTGECLRTFIGHSDIVNSVVYSPDGGKILSASGDCTIKEWDAITGECINTIRGHKGPILSTIYNSDGKKILSTSFDKTIREWSAKNGECYKTIAGHTGTVTSAVYSPDGKKILSASGDGTIKEWDAITGKCIKTIVGHINTIWSVVYSPDGKKILSASGDHTIKEWNSETGECIKIMFGHNNAVWDVEYSADGKKILSASYDRTIKEWDALTGECINTINGPTNWIRSAMYSRDEKKILSTSGDSSIIEWDTGTGECIKTMNGYKNTINSAVYSRDGERILFESNDKTIKEWDAKTGQCLRIYEYNDLRIPHINYYKQNSKLKMQDNKILIQDSSGETKKELINIPGLIIQGCSFENLKKGSQWSEEGLRIMKMYGAKISISED